MALYSVTVRTCCKLPSILGAEVCSFVGVAERLPAELTGLQTSKLQSRFSQNIADARCAPHYEYIPGILYEVYIFVW
jgi:hypothetical protein